MPKISVVMPVYNAAPFLREAIESILNQTNKDFEFLIFNDGSTDNSADIIQSYKDPRIKFFNSEKNYGYVKHLNDGIKLAQGEYIARMDADDISLPKRFEKQVEFLDNNSDYGVCGTGVHQYYRNNKKSIYLMPTSHEEIQTEQFFNNAFIHPTVFLRNDLLKTNKLSYNADDMPAEDYNLWSKILQHSKGNNLIEPLLLYRRHENQISNNEIMRVAKANKARAKYLSMLIPNLSDEKVNKHLTYISSKWVAEENYINEALEWFKFLVNENKKNNIFIKDIFIQNIARLIYFNCYALTTHNFNAMKFFVNSELKSSFNPPLKLRIKSVLKILIK